jgi:hypothetical protein
MTEKPTIYELMAKVMAAVQAVGKDSRNTEQGYSFRGIDAVVNAAGPRLREFGVIPVPVLHESTWRDVRTSRDKPARECTVKVAYRFYGPAGDYVEAVVPGESMDFGDKGAAKAMSVAYRIALLQVLCIPTDEADPDAHSYERAPEGERPPTASEVRSAIAKVGAAKGMLPDAIAGDFAAWSKGGHIGVTEDVRLLGEYLTHMQAEAPKETTP